MPRPLLDSPYIFGIHEPGGEALMAAAEHPGWILFSDLIGHNHEDFTAVDYSSFSDRGFGVLVRLNNGYEPDGTLPNSREYEAFARRCANYVATSRGCKIWIIGNEPNYAIERPGIKIDWSRHATRRDGPAYEADPTRRGLPIRFNVLPDNSREIRTTRGAMISPGEVITPEMYARCYRYCRDAIHRLPGHESDLVLTAAIAPWNTQTIYPGNPNGDWVQYFRDMLDAIGPENCDGVALHAYTHGSDSSLVSSPLKMAAPFQTRHLHFRTYQDFVQAMPPAMRQLPVFLSEIGQADSWWDQNSGWIQAAYQEVDSWNRQPGAQQIRAAILYRWPQLDRWYMAGKQGVEDDFRAAVTNDFRWKGSEVETPVVERPKPVPEAVAAPVTPAEFAPAESDGRRERRTRKELRETLNPPYRVEWVVDHFPAKLMAGQTLQVPITVRNGGSLTWSWGGGNPFRLGYRYYRNRRPLPMAAAKDLRTDIPHDVAPGETAVIEARIALPDDPGNYTVEFDLIQEGMTWFKEKGSPVLSRWLTVESAGADAARANGGALLPVKLFTDIVQKLPRSKTPYARRSPNQIKYIVVSHTGANPALGLERIAKAHMRRGYPGIAYDFVVDATGQIFKVSEIEEVAQPDQVWSEQGVNICLTGNFNHDMPPLSQLDSTGRLCAWLAQNLGLTAEGIIGLGELIRSESPGDTFYRGPAWKEMLRRQVQLHLAALGAAAGDPERMQELDKLVGDLRGEVNGLKHDLAQSRTAEQQANRSVAELRQEMSGLQKQIKEAASEVQGGFRLHNWVDKLPRERSRYVTRRGEDVDHLLIYHTGTAATTPLADLARSQMPAWPGLLYDFVVDAQGELYQTQPLEQVPDTTEPYVRRAVSIAFAGDYATGLPPAVQINAAARLLLWLLERYPRLSESSIRGLSEFIEAESPGGEWLGGRNWKSHLLAAVRKAAGSALADATVLRLQERIAELERTLESAQREQAGLQGSRKDALDEAAQLRQDLQAMAVTPASFVVPRPAMRVIVDQLPKHPQLRYERRSTSQISHIAIHHTGTPARVGPARIAELHISADPARGKEAWPGIGYHFFVHEDGVIEQTNHLETIAYHVYRHAGYSAGIVFAGSFMNGKIPTTAQLRAGAHLVAWLMQELKVPLARVWGHREFPDNATICPGGEWTQGNRWRDLLFERIEQIQQGAGLKSVRHYLLFWQREGGSAAHEEFMAALPYVSRFRPTVGFSVDEARSAEFVTIVGSEAGISAVVEQALVASGCRVERVAGRDEAETGQLLAELARAGRRFRLYDVDF